MGRSRKDPQPPHGGNLRCSEGGGVKFTLDVLGCPKGGGGGVIFHFLRGGIADFFWNDPINTFFLLYY